MAYKTTEKMRTKEEKKKKTQKVTRSFILHNTQNWYEHNKTGGFGLLDTMIQLRLCNNNK